MSLFAFRRGGAKRTACAVAVALIGSSWALPALTPSASAETGPAINFESGYSNGSVNGQDGWQSTGAFDQAVVDATPYGYATFGTKAFRISNSVTTGAFGDQTYTPSLANEAG